MWGWVRKGYVSRYRRRRRHVEENIVREGVVSHGYPCTHPDKWVIHTGTGVPKMNCGLWRTWAGEEMSRKQKRKKKPVWNKKLQRESIIYQPSLLSCPSQLPKGLAVSKCNVCPWKGKGRLAGLCVWRCVVLFWTPGNCKERGLPKCLFNCLSSLVSQCLKE